MDRTTYLLLLYMRFASNALAECIIFWEYEFAYLQIHCIMEHQIIFYSILHFLDNLNYFQQLII